MQAHSRMGFPFPWEFTSYNNFWNCKQEQHTSTRSSHPQTPVHDANDWRGGGGGRGRENKHRPKATTTSIFQFYLFIYLRVGNKSHITFAWLIEQNHTDSAVILIQHPLNFQMSRAWCMSAASNILWSVKDWFLIFGTQSTFRASWRVDVVVVGRGNAGWTMSKSGHPCPCQNCSRWPTAQKTERLRQDVCWIVPHAPPPPRTTKSVKEPKWTAQPRRLFF